MLDRIYACCRFLIVLIVMLGDFEIWCFGEMI